MNKEITKMELKDLAKLRWKQYLDLGYADEKYKKMKKERIDVRWK